MSERDANPNSRNLDLQLLVACEEGDLELVKSLVEQGADVCFQEFESGLSALMVAASAGHDEVVRYLLQEGAPWNAVDRTYMCAGDYAAKHGQQNCVDVILDHAVMSELLLSLSMQSDLESDSDSDSEQPTLITTTKTPHTPNESLNASYLSSHLEYTKDGKCLVDTQTRLAVMMDWEQPLMALHAAWICFADDAKRSRTSGDLRVLNVGFGMGIVDQEIQKHRPTSHVIIEAHPEVFNKMEVDGWTSKPGVQVIRSRWQAAVPKLAEQIASGECAPFDGIFFDTYAEDDLDLRRFHAWLPKLLRRDSCGARYSYYNGVCPDNVFFHGVACETIRLHLNRLGIDCTFEPISVDVSDPKMWKDLSSRYWYFDKYFLPKCTLRVTL